MKGTVKWFNKTKGYGFITKESGGELFVHYSAIQVEGYKDLSENEVVEFDEEVGDKGPKAVNVRKV